MFSHEQSFKLEHPDTGKFVYAGVYDYSSPSPEMASLPRWMMEHLGASEGEEMTFDHVDLPQGTFVKLQPVSSAWLVSIATTAYMYIHEFYMERGDSILSIFHCKLLNPVR